MLYMLVVRAEVADFVVNAKFDVADVLLDHPLHALDKSVNSWEGVTRGHKILMKFVLGVVHGKGFVPNLPVCAKKGRLAKSWDQIFFE